MNAAEALHARATRRGIICMVAAMAFFTVNDAFFKLAAANLPVWQVIFLRSFLVVLLTFAAARSVASMDVILGMFRGRLGLRALTEATAMLLYLWSLTHIPIANAAAIILSSPLFLAGFAALFLGERVTAGRWAAALLGFVGVLLIVQPRPGAFDIWTLVCLVSTVLFATRDVLTRGIPVAIPSTVVALATAVAGTVLALVMMLMTDIKPVGARAAGYIVAAAFFVAAGFYLIAVSFRSAEVSVVGPFRYSSLLVAVALGYLVWGEVPNALGWLGVTLMLGTGALMLVLERRRS
ncbi:MAG: DMT family transporter [Burkholderiales bacterium]